MKSYIYVGTEEYFAPISDPKVVVNTGDVIEVNAEQEKKLDKRFFFVADTESVQNLEQQVKDFEVLIENINTEKKQIEADQKAIMEENIKRSTEKHNNSIANATAQIENLKSMIEVVKK